MPHLTVITGPMFSGKSEELIRLAKRQKYAKKKILTIKPRLDTRQSSIRSRQVQDDGTITTHAELDAKEVSSREEFETLLAIENPDALFIDEAHFLGDWIIAALQKQLQEKSLRIFVSGLDLTAWNEPFGPMPQLLALADEVIKLTAVCFQCGEEANLTFKYAKGSGIIQVGDGEIYEARCRKCWHIPK
jgi:thymidine kinase